jgi:hypothetical protein
MILLGNFFVYTCTLKLITKLPNSEQSYRGKLKTHKYINRQNQSTTGKLWFKVMSMGRNGSSLAWMIVCKRTRCVKIIFISVSRDTNNIIHKNNVTRRSKARLTKCTIFHKKHHVFHIRMYNIKYTCSFLIVNYGPQYYYCSFQIQPDDTDTCGRYCMYYFN